MIRTALIGVSLVVSTAFAAKCDTYSCEVHGQVRKPNANTIDCLHGGQCKEDEGATELCCNIHCRTHISGTVTLAVPRGTQLGTIECAYDLGLNENAKVCTGAKYFAVGCPTSTCLSNKPLPFCVNSQVALSANNCVWGPDSCKTCYICDKCQGKADHCPNNKGDKSEFFCGNDEEGVAMYRNKCEKCQDKADDCPNEGEFFCGNDEEGVAMYDKGDKFYWDDNCQNKTNPCPNEGEIFCFSHCISTVGLTEVGNKAFADQYKCTTDQEKEYLALVGSICHEPDRGDPNKYCGSDGGVGDITTLMYNEDFKGGCIDDATCPDDVFVEDSKRTCQDWIAMNLSPGKCYATCTVGFSDIGIDAVMKRYGCTKEEITQYKSVNKENKLYENKLKGTSGACRSAGAYFAAATVAFIASVALV